MSEISAMGHALWGMERAVDDMEQATREVARTAVGEESPDVTVNVSEEGRKAYAEREQADPAFEQTVVNLKKGGHSYAANGKVVKASNTMRQALLMVVE
ncbi:MAG: hypothetical protein QGG40_13620 [Myxococcota bacterium]|nr:hypothetical protein [Myxococcota bacterium]